MESKWGLSFMLDFYPGVHKASARASFTTIQDAIAAGDSMMYLCWHMKVPVTSPHYIVRTVDCDGEEFSVFSKEFPDRPPWERK